VVDQHVRGREAATLVDEEQTAGWHEITFDAAKLSSGLFFYKLKTENLLEIKKMILIK